MGGGALRTGGHVSGPQARARLASRATDRRAALTSLAAAWRRLRWSGEAPSASLLNPVRLSLGRTRMRKTSPAPMQTHPPGAALAGSTCIGLRPASAQERHRGTSASRVPSACQEIQGAAEMS